MNIVMIPSANQPAKLVRYKKNYVKHLLTDKSRNIVYVHMTTMLPVLFEKLPEKCK